MFGIERAQAGIIIETVSSLQIDVQDSTQLAELRNKIWYGVGASLWHRIDIVRYHAHN